MKTTRKSDPICKRKGWAIVPLGVTAEQRNVITVGLGFAKQKFNASEYFTDKKFWTPAAKRFDGMRVHILRERRDVIAQDAEIDHSEVARVLAELEALGWMQCVRAPRKGRGRSVGVYIFAEGKERFAPPRSILLVNDLTKPKRSHRKKSVTQIAPGRDYNDPKTRPGADISPIKTRPGAMNHQDATQQDRIQEDRREQRGGSSVPVSDREERLRARDQKIKELAEEYAEAMDSQGMPATALRLKFDDRRIALNVQGSSPVWNVALRAARKTTTKYKADEQKQLTARRYDVADRFLRGENVEAEREALNLHGVTWTNLLKLATKKGA